MASEWGGTAGKAGPPHSSIQDKQGVAMINSNGVAAWLRTVVPVGWGALVAFLLSRFPSVHEMLVNPAVVTFVTGLVVAAWYSLWKWLEPRLPAWLTVLVLGYDRPPVYFVGEVYDNGYQAGQDDMHVAMRAPAGPQLHPAVLEQLRQDWDAAHADATEKFLAAWEAGKRTPPETGQPERSISRPGESSGPHALTDIMPAVPADKDESGEDGRHG